MRSESPTPREVIPMLRKLTRNSDALGAGVALAVLIAASLACVAGEDTGAADSFGEIANRNRW